MNEAVFLQLPRIDVWQVLDALYERKERWEYTAEYLNTGKVSEQYLIEECSDSEEATSIAESYKKVIKSIEEQM
jgi:hypothetical protein